MPQIRLENVSKWYNKDEKNSMPAVSDINLTIEQGEFVFVTGSSGAGKSTLLQLIARRIQPSRGTIYLNQTNVKHFPIWKQRQLAAMFGYVPQISQLIRKKTIGEHLELAAMATQTRNSQPVQARMRKVLGMVGLPDVYKKYPVELSSGEGKRIELALAMIGSPSILILDELTANLDEDTTWDMMHCLSELNHQGTTIIMATHAKTIVNLLRKRVITLVDGKILGDVPRGRYGDITLQAPPVL